MEAAGFEKRQAERKQRRTNKARPMPGQKRRRRSSVAGYLRTFAGQASKEVTPPQAVLGVSHSARQAAEKDEAIYSRAGRQRDACVHAYIQTY